MTADRRRRTRERVEGMSFMDVAREAFVRHLALDKWRDVEDLREANGFDLPTAVREAGAFPERWPYHDAWRRRWVEHVLPAAAVGDPAAVYAAVEAAVAAALGDEEAERAARGDRPLAEDPQYRRFIDHALGRLAREARGGLEGAAP